MDETFPCTESLREHFMKELEQRLYDGCSVTFTVPRHVGITLARNAFKRLEARDCCTMDIDLSNLSTVEEFAIRLLHEALRLGAGVNALSGNSINDFLEDLSRPEIRVKIQDLVDVPYLRKLKENPLDLLDEGVRLLERLPERFNKRLVVWFHEFQTITRIDNGVLLLKRLRAMFQHQTYVSFSFTGSEQELMTKLFSDHDQAFYRFAVRLHFPE